MPPRRNITMADVAAMIAQQLAGVIPTIVAQVTAAVQQQPPHNPPPPPVNQNVQGCSYKEFLNCKPSEFDGKGGALILSQWLEQAESVFDISNCSNQNRVRYSTHLLKGKALTWWNSVINARGRDVAMAISWEDFKTLILDQFVSRTEVKKLEDELWSLTMEGNNLNEYTDKFHDLVRLCPRMVDTEARRIERYIHGLHPEVRRSLRGIDPPTLQDAIHRAESITEDLKRDGILKEKRKDHGDDEQEKSKKVRRDQGQSSNGSKSGYTGTLPLCQKCNYHHEKSMLCTCSKCQRRGHVAKDCRVRPIAAEPINAVNPNACFGCGNTGHFLRDCPNKLGNDGRNIPLQIEGAPNNQGKPARARAYFLGAAEEQQNANNDPGAFS
jgi:hypothetical protein